MRNVKTKYKVKDSIFNIFYEKNNLNPFAPTSAQLLFYYIFKHFQLIMTFINHQN